MTYFRRMLRLGLLGNSQAEGSSASLLLTDGSSFLLLVDGSSHLLLTGG